MDQFYVVEHIFLQKSKWINKIEVKISVWEARISIMLLGAREK